MGTVGDRVGLLLHEEDLEVTSLLAERPDLVGEVAAAAVFVDPGERSPAGVSDAVAAFTAGAVADAAERTRDAGGRTARVLADAEPGSVVTWARSDGLDTVVVPYAPVGPVHERLGRLRPVLEAEGIALVTVRRRWDGVAWPHASRGSSRSVRRSRGSSASSEVDAEEARRSRRDRVPMNAHGFRDVSPLESSR